MGLGSIYHLTVDGADTLCGVDGMKIHLHYADRVLDGGQWCGECQRLKKMLGEFVAEAQARKPINFRF